MPNGMALGHDGYLVVCEQGTRSEPARISRVDPVTGQAEGLVDGWGGLRLNSPKSGDLEASAPVIRASRVSAKVL